MLSPPAISSWASAQIRAHGGGRCPSGPSATGQVMSIVCALEDVAADLAHGLELVVAEDRLVEDQLVGVGRALVEEVALAAEARSTGSSRSASRIGSIGGLVTWAKSCLK